MQHTVTTNYLVKHGGSFIQMAGNNVTLSAAISGTFFSSSDLTLGSNAAISIGAEVILMN